MRLLFPPVICLSVALSAIAAPVCRTVAELNGIRRNGTGGAISFDITGTVTHAPLGRTLVVRDGSGTTDIALQTKAPFSATTGDVVRLEGDTFLDVFGKRWADARRATRIGTAATPPPVAATVEELADGKFDFSVIRTSGTVVDAMPDEIDADFDYAILADGSKTIPISCHRCETNADDALRHLIGARIEVIGYCNPASGNRRRFHARGLSARLADTRVVEPAAADPFDVPQLDNRLYTDPDRIYRLGRRRTDGTVLASWGRRHILLSDGNRLVRAQTPDPADLPAVGSRVRVVGYPETDLFNLNLSGAHWRPADGIPARPEKPVRAGLHDIVPRNRKRHYAPEWHGRLVTLKGRTLEIVPSATAGRMLLSCDGGLVHADISACGDALSDVPVDATVEATGVCLMDVENWRPAAPFPHIRGFQLVIRAPQDITVLSRPSWWTHGRLLATLGGLILVTLGIGVWNRLLKRTSDRKGCEIAEQRLAIIASQLKVGERTRLSVELHDALSQTLSAVSMQIDAVRRYADRDRAKMDEHLDIAAKTIGSCQTELHNCLWDLRNSTLDAADMDEAIREAARPHIGEARLDVRVSVPRDRLSDSTAHAILRIVRELAANAVRHGRATRVGVAGVVEGDRLAISVRDNGGGFDPDAAPGIDRGHFGLQGIRERIDELDGEFLIVSAPGRGTRAMIRLRIPTGAES